MTKLAELEAEMRRRAKATAVEARMVQNSQTKAMMMVAVSTYRECADLVRDAAKEG